MADWTLHRGAAPRRKIPLWVEPYAGSLAVGLRLLGASHLVGWMGGKSRYADAIMSILNVDACDEVWCADISPWAACWRALSRPRIAKAAADIIEEIEADALSRGDCPASYRAVWLELREEHRRRPMAEDARAVAVWLVMVKGSAMCRGPEAGSMHVAETSWRMRNNGTKIARDTFVSPAARLRLLPDPLPVRVWNDAAAIPPRRGAVVLLDPPYVGTRGYQEERTVCSSAAVRAAAVRDAWLARGSIVATCEGASSAGGVPYDLSRRESRPATMRLRGGSPTGEWLTVYRGPVGAHPLLWDRAGCAHG